MAEFDPVIQPLNDPSYTRDSRGVDVPNNIRPEGVQQNQILPRGVDTPDRSAEYIGKSMASSAEASGAASKGLADLFAGIIGIGDFSVKAADAIIKKDIERQVYDLADKERQEYTARLEEVAFGAGAKKSRSLFDANAEMTDADNLPTDLENLPETLNSLKAASDAGKISNTYYTGRLLAHAKELRARYPGHRQYIDDQFAQVTGMNPANARIQALTSDINRAVTSRQTLQNKMITEVLKWNGYANEGIDATKALQKIQSGEWTSLEDVSRWTAKGAAREYELKLKALERADRKGSAEEQVQNATVEAGLFAAVKVENMINRIEARAGITTPADIKDRIERSNIDPTEWRGIINDLKLSRDTIIADVKQKLYEGGRDSMAARMRMTPAQVDEFAAGSVKDYDRYIKAVEDKDTGMIERTANWIKDKTNANIQFAMKDADIGSLVQISQFVEKTLGNNPTMLKMWNDRLIFQNSSGKWKGFLTTFEAQFRSGERADATGVPRVYNDLATAIEKNEIKDKAHVTKIINAVGDIAKPDIPDAEKLALIKAAFSARNQKFIARLNPDGVDAKGRDIPGQWATFSRWTSPTVAAEVKRLSDRYDPKIWKDYQNWTEDTLVNQLIPKQLMNLNSIQDEANLRVSWNSSTLSFRQETTLTTEQKRLLGLGAGRTPRMQQIDATLDRINEGNIALASVAKALNIDPEEYVFKTLMDAGLNPASGRIKGLNAKLVDAIRNSKLKDKMTPDANRNK